MHQPPSPPPLPALSAMIPRRFQSQSSTLVWFPSGAEKCDQWSTYCYQQMRESVQSCSVKNLCLARSQIHERQLSWGFRAYSWEFSDMKRGDCEYQAGKLLRLLSQLRPRIRPQKYLYASTEFNAGIEIRLRVLSTTTLAIALFSTSSRGCSLFGKKTEMDLSSTE